MKNIVVRNIKRTDADLLKRLGALGVATVHEAYGRNDGAEHYGSRHQRRRARCQIAARDWLSGVVEGDLGQGHGKATPGPVNVPVVCACINFKPGDAVIADEDGVAVVGRKDAAEVVERGEKRHADEAGKRKQLAAGVLGLDMYDMRESLKKAGLIDVDELPED